MKKILTLAVPLCVFIYADEFVEAGTSFGGYGELHYDIEGEGLDFHRFVLFFNNTWDDQWSFKSEVELEHNMVGGAIDNDVDSDTNGEIAYPGEVELEQAFVNYYNGFWGFQGGVLLMPAGIINEYHEPPTFLSVERPEYAKKIIPTTWFGNGFAFYGGLGNVNWKVTLLEDLDGDKVGAGIRDARGKGYKTSATDWTKNVQLIWHGMEGLRIGGSVTMNDAPKSDGSTVEVCLTEINATYLKNNIYARFENGKINYTDNGAIESSSGYYLDLGYNLTSILKCNGSFMLWTRTSSYSTDDNGKAHDVSLFGVTFKPNNNVSFKFETGESGNNDVLRMGIGYMF